MSNERWRQIRNCRVVKSSGCHRYDYWNEQHLFDGNLKTGWCTPSRSQPQLEYLEIDLSKEYQLERVRILSRSINRDAGFPVNFKLFGVTVKGQQELILEESGYANDTDCWHEWVFKPIQTKYVRLEISEVGIRPESKYFLQFMNLELFERMKQGDHYENSDHL